jgi:hypothetical protein
MSGDDAWRAKEAAFRVRLAQACLWPDDGVPFWWDGPQVPRNVAHAERAKLLAALHRAEFVHGPPTATDMLARREFEARHDPLMPAWIERPWFVPSSVMLAIDALFEAEFGRGYSATGGGAEGRWAIKDPRQRTSITFLVIPEPGSVGPPDRRRALEAAMPARLAAIGLPDGRVAIWNETPPAKAFLGMMSGRVIRSGHVRLGIPREHASMADCDDI